MLMVSIASPRSTSQSPICLLMHFFYYEAQGLAHSSELSSSGYLVFIKIRSGNSASNKWIHEDYIITEIARADEANTSLALGGLCSAIYIDGEHGILTAGADASIVANYQQLQISTAITDCEGPFCQYQSCCECECSFYCIITLCAFGRRCSYRVFTGSLVNKALVEFV